MEIDELRHALDEAWNGAGEHVERLILVTAILQTALRQAGMVPTLVGGAAIEFYAPGAYTTSDIDLVVERKTREAIHEVFTALGLSRQGRHWVRGDLYVEVPGNYLGEAADEVPIGRFTLRVVRKESVLADRIVGVRAWKYWGYAFEAIDMLRTFGNALDEESVKRHLRGEGAEELYEPLREMAKLDRPVTEKEIEALWHRYYR